ncbi:glutaredoxin domain-containing protein [Bacillus solitudinis]|uniref:glutaredoxin domain-containing protein n=1 Tax=Bacillus solitudinis TaxID=2014074 RepID=UPI001D0D5FA0|nr:glutaredoxin domain-containing protein [Bacillus solitudinis]
MKVFVYTQEKCRPCHAEKEWLKSHNIDFEERDVRKDPIYLEEILKFNASSTPVTVIEREKGEPQVIMGFHVRRLAEALGVSLER